MARRRSALVSTSQDRTRCHLPRSFICYTRWVLAALLLPFLHPYISFRRIGSMATMPKPEAKSTICPASHSGRRRLWGPLKKTHGINNRRVAWLARRLVNPLCLCTRISISRCGSGDQDVMMKGWLDISDMEGTYMLIYWPTLV